MMRETLPGGPKPNSRIRHSSPQFSAHEKDLSISSVFLQNNIFLYVCIHCRLPGENELSVPLAFLKSKPSRKDIPKVQQRKIIN